MFLFFFLKRFRFIGDCLRVYFLKKKIWLGKISSVSSSRNTGFTSLLTKLEDMKSFLSRNRHFICVRRDQFIIMEDCKVNMGRSVGIIKIIISNSRVSIKILKKSFSLFFTLLSITENKSKKTKCLRS